MNSSRHIIYALALSLAAGGVFLACGSDSEGDDDDGPSAPSGDAGGSKGSDNLKIVYSPMYSAFEPSHQYQVPAVVEGLPPGLKWTATPADAVDVVFDDMGALFTMKKAGDVTIKATAPNGDFGTATLKVQAATADLYATGEKRYNQPNPAFVAGDGGTGFPGIDPTASCTNCHGATSTLKVEHTPQQTAGYSDEELIEVFTNAKKPEGAPQRVTNLPAAAWQQLHKWKMNDDEKKGIVVYLRSLQPKPTVSSIDFGGLIRTLADAGLIDPSRFGRRDGGFTRNDGGTGGSTNRDGGTASVTGIDSGT